MVDIEELEETQKELKEEQEKNKKLSEEFEKVSKQLQESKSKTYKLLLGTRIPITHNRKG